MRALISTLAVTLIAAGQTAAQEMHRQGFWWGIGVGAAWVEMDCERCRELPDSIPYGPGRGFHLSLAAGGTLAPRLIAGIVTSAAARVGENRDATLITLNPVAQFYPRADGRLFIRGGVGFSNSILAGGGTLIEATGVGAHFDVGMDVWRRGRRVIAPYVGFVLATNEESFASIARPELLDVGPPRCPRALYAGANVVWH